MTDIERLKRYKTLYETNCDNDIQATSDDKKRAEIKELYSKNITTFDNAIVALEKQIPKKPRETRCALMCANCGHKITEKGCKKLNRLYCKKCGQAIQWGDIE